MKRHTYLIALLAAVLALPVLGAEKGCKIHDENIKAVLPDGRVELNLERGACDEGLAPITRWDYNGPELHSWGHAVNESVSGGLEIRFKFDSAKTFGADMVQNFRIIGDELRGPEATYALLAKRNPTSFLAQADGTGDPLPPGEAERHANAQSEGPGFWQRPSTYLTGGGAALAAYLLSEEVGGSDGETTAVNVQDSENVAINTGSGSAEASQATAPPPEPAVVQVGQ